MDVFGVFYLGVCGEFYNVFNYSLVKVFMGDMVVNWNMVEYRKVFRKVCKVLFLLFGFLVN